MNALYHFLSWEVDEGRWPNPWFDPSWYREQNPDVGDAGMNPLGHYARFGHKEGRLPCAAFDSNWYRAEYLKTQPDVDPLSFHIEFGAAAGLSVNSAEDSSRSRQTPIRTRSLEFVERAARDGAEVKLPDQAIPRGKLCAFAGKDGHLTILS